MVYHHRRQLQVKVRLLLFSQCALNVEQPSNVLTNNNTRIVMLNSKKLFAYKPYRALIPALNVHMATSPCRNSSANLLLLVARGPVLLRL